MLWAMSLMYWDFIKGALNDSTELCTLSFVLRDKVQNTEVLQDALPTISIHSRTVRSSVFLQRNDPA
jgi:hypothetical protein